MEKRLELKQGDITQEEADALVNAANAGLRGGGGVDGAIHRVGGPEIMKACDEIRGRTGGCPTGQAVMTPAGKLSARYVIHAVAPIWRGGFYGEARLLTSAYRQCLELCEEHELAHVAFPSLGTGAYGYPCRQAALIALSTILDFLIQCRKLEHVTIVLFDEDTLDTFQQALQVLARLGRY